MPNKEDSARHRMVVEEIEIPQKTSVVEETTTTIIAESKPGILDEAAKVSSQDLMNEDVVIKPTSEPTPPQNDTVPQEKKSDFISDKPEKVKKEGSPVAWILIPGIFILGAILGGVIFYQKGVNTIKVEESPAPQATIAPANTPTPTPVSTSSANISKFDVAVFNGSGTAGEAGKVKDILTTAGFTVTSTGNAATYDYTKTIIKAKSTVDASVVQKLKDALSKSYVVGDSQTLSSSATTDIQVVVGSSKAE